MEMSSTKWLSEMDIMEDPSCSLFHEYEIDTFDYSIDDLHFQSFSPESYSETQPPKPIIEANCSTSVVVERPLKQLKTNSWSSSKASPPPPLSSTQLISFGASQSLFKAPKVEMGGLDHEESMKYPSMMYSSYDYEDQQIKPGQGHKRSTCAPTRSPLHAQDHVIAERKRREKLSQRFIALSALVPGLKKTDKASVLGDTIKYLKQLQERVNTLEEQSAQRTVESVIYVNKSQLLSSDDETSSCDESFTSQSSSQPLPEIEARISDKDVLIKIHCEKQKGSTVKILNEVEKLRLTVINSSVLPFGKSIFDITIVAKMEDGICMSAKDLATNLRAALLKFM